MGAKKPNLLGPTWGLITPKAGAPLGGSSLPTIKPVEKVSPVVPQGPPAVLPTSTPTISDTTLPTITTPLPIPNPSTPAPAAGIIGDLPVLPVVKRYAQKGSLSKLRFAMAYMEGLPLADCLIAAGSKGTSRASLHKEGHKFLKRPSVQAAIEELGAGESATVEEGIRRGLAKLLSLITRAVIKDDAITPEHVVAATRLLGQFGGRFNETPTITINTTLPRMSHLSDTIIDVTPAPGSSKDGA